MLALKLHFGDGWNEARGDAPQRIDDIQLTPFEDWKYCMLWAASKPEAREFTNRDYSNIKEVYQLTRTNRLLSRKKHFLVQIVM